MLCLCEILVVYPGYPGLESSVSVSSWQVCCVGRSMDGKSKQTVENAGITFTGRPHTSLKLISKSFNRQFTTSKLGKHSSSRTRHVSKDVKRMSLEEAESFNSDQITSSIKSCRSSRTYGPDSLSIFHLKHLGPLATQHLTALYIQ